MKESIHNGHGPEAQSALWFKGCAKAQEELQWKPKIETKCTVPLWLSRFYMFSFKVDLRKRRAPVCSHTSSLVYLKQVL